MMRAKSDLFTKRREQRNDRDSQNYAYSHFGRVEDTA